MKLLRLAASWLLEWIASRLPERQEKAAHEATLPEELRASISRLSERIRPERPESEKAEEGGEAGSSEEGGAQPVDGAEAENKKKINLQAFAAKFSGIKEHFSFLSKLNTFAGMLVTLVVMTALVYAFLYFSYAQTPVINSEDNFRLKTGRPFVRVAYVKEWLSSESMARMISVLISQNMNAEVMLKPFSQNDPEHVFTLLAKGEVDIFPSAWMPDTHGKLVSELERQDLIKDLGASVRGAKMGLAAAGYMKIKRIEDLKKVDFGKQIYGIDPGSKLNRMTHEAIGIYGLDGTTVVEKTDYYALGKLAQALNEKKNVVIATWQPNWIFGAYDIVMLDDPQKVFGEPENIHILASRQFADALPRITECLRQVKINMREFDAIMAAMHQNPERSKAASDWLLLNRMRVRMWLEPLLD